MPHQSYDQRFVALTQLETALRLYREGGDNLFSTLTLAGAAEEILGKMLMARKVETSLQSLIKAAVAIGKSLSGEQLDEREFALRANRARNSLKHLTESPTVTLDIAEETVDMLNRAIENYWLLETSMTPAMDAFVKAQRGAE